MASDVDLDDNLDKMNKTEMRDLIKAYRFLALCHGVKHEELVAIEHQSRLASRNK